MKKFLKIMFDVDGTLITFDEKPRYEVIAIFHLLQGLGHRVGVWSGGGLEYAQKWVEKLGLEPDFVLCKFGSHSFTPDITFDDIPETNFGCVNILV